MSSCHEGNTQYYIQAQTNRRDSGFTHINVHESEFSREQSIELETSESIEGKQTPKKEHPASNV